MNEKKHLFYNGSYRGLMKECRQSLSSLVVCGWSVSSLSIEVNDC